MQTRLLWKGRNRVSLEECIVRTLKNGVDIEGVILCEEEEKIYKVEYGISVNERWETLSFRINSRTNGKAWLLHLESDAQGRWTIDGKAWPGLNGCLDVDLSLSPFTNTLPIRRLGLADGQSKEIQVVYCDPLTHTVKSVHQRYTRLSGTHYRYQNVPNDFEAVIEVDPLGLLVDYPGLFVRVAQTGR